MKTKSITFKLITAVLTAALIIGLLPNSVSAQAPVPTATKNSCDCQIVEKLDFPNGFTLLQMKDGKGTIHYVATQLVKEVGGQKLNFGELSGKIDYDKLKEDFSNPEIVSPLSTVNWIDGWIYWDNNNLTIYINHDTAAVWAAGSGIAALLCGLLASFLPPAAPAGALCVILTGLSAVTIVYYDDYGNPGFYVKATFSPLSMWLEP